MLTQRPGQLGQKMQAWVFSGDNSRELEGPGGLTELAYLHIGFLWIGLKTCIFSLISEDGWGFSGVVAWFFKTSLPR